MWKVGIRRPSPSLVVACIALLVALGGTGYATVLQVPRNSVGTPQLKRGAVGTPQLKRNAVKARQLAPNAVRSAHVLNGSLLVEDFKPGQLPQGPKGDKGDKGDAGPPGAVSTIVTRSTTNDVGDGVYSRRTVSCNSGEKAIGGGVGTTSTASDVSLRESKPTNGGNPVSSGAFTSWTGALLNITGGVGTAQLTVWVVCVT